MSDGVVGDTIVFVRKNKSIYTSRVDELLSDCCSTSNEPNFSGVEVWTNDSFQPLANITKIETSEQIVRVLTNTGVVDCNVTYKLLKQKNKPTSIGELAPAKSKLAHQTDATLLLQQYDLLPDDIDCKEAFALGAFASFGACETLSAETGAYWRIEHTDEKFLMDVKNCLPFATGLYDTLQPPGRFRLTLSCDEQPICAYYREKCFNKHGEKRVPDFIMNAPQAVVVRFWAGLLPRGRSVTAGAKSHGTLTAHGKQLAADVWLLSRRIGFNVVLYETVSSAEPDTTMFDLHCLWMKSKYDPSEVRYVYELTKGGEKHMLYRVNVANSKLFSVGPGNLLVANVMEEK